MTQTAPPRKAERIEVQFLMSAPSLSHCPSDSEREIAFAGRSNAGKSSVLNRLTGNRNTAKVSKTPGRTQLLNLFAVRGGGRVVDLPGYGYAKADRTAQARWQAAVNQYLEGRGNLVGVVVVMDIRHPLQALDADLIRWASVAGLNLLILLNKADKLSFSAQQQTRKRVIGELRPLLVDPGAATVLTFSALRGLHVIEVIELLTGWLESPPDAGDSAEEPG